MDHENIRLMKRVERLESQVAELLLAKNVPHIVHTELPVDVYVTPMKATGGTTQPEKRGRGRPRKS